jgi:hypothetical protein
VDRVSIDSMYRMPCKNPLDFIPSSSMLKIWRIIGVREESNAPFKRILPTFQT